MLQSCAPGQQEDIRPWAALRHRLHDEPAHLIPAQATARSALPWGGTGVAPGLAETHGFLTVMPENRVLPLATEQI